MLVGTGMIFFLVTAPHAYTVDALLGNRYGVPVDCLSYMRLIQLRTLPRATYIFTDLDRLPTERLRIASTIYREMRRQGLLVLNDPARVLSRHGLLRRRFLSGFNQ